MPRAKDGSPVHQGKRGGRSPIDVAVLPAPSHRSPPFGFSVSLTPVSCTTPRVPPSRAHLEPPVPLVPTPRVLGPQPVFSLLSSRSSFWPLQAVSRGHSWLSCCCEVKVAQSCPTLRPHGIYSPWNSPGQNNGVGSLSLLQGIFPTQGLNSGLPHCRQSLYCLSHRRSPSYCCSTREMRESSQPSVYSYFRIVGILGRPRNRRGFLRPTVLGGGG